MYVWNVYLYWASAVTKTKTTTTNSNNNNSTDVDKMRDQKIPKYIRSRSQYIVFILTACVHDKFSANTHWENSREKKKIPSNRSWYNLYKTTWTISIYFTQLAVFFIVIQSNWVQENSGKLGILKRASKKKKFNSKREKWFDTIFVKLMPRINSTFQWYFMSIMIIMT